METFIGKKEKWTNKETDKQYVADFFYYTAQIVIPNLCNKSIILGQVVADKL